MLRVFSIWMPGFTRVIAAKLFQTSPAQTRSTIVSAICAMTSAPRSRTDCRPAEPLLPSRNESMASTRVACQAGKSPKTTPVINAVTPVTASTVAIIADHLIAQRTDVKIPALVKLRITLREPAGDRREFGLDSGSRDAGLQ